MSSLSGVESQVHGSPVVSEDAVVTCSWSVLNERRIEDAVTLEVTHKSSPKKSLEGVVSLETCVQLCDQNHSTPCLVEVKLKKTGMFITDVCIVSEARIIEVYGKCGEYLATSHGDFLDECEGMIVYTADIKLPQCLSECSFKFARTKAKGQMWLYGIHMMLECDMQVPSETSVNFQNVNKILKESGHQLTDKADKCKKFLQMYSSYWDTNNPQSTPNPQTVLRMLDAVYLNSRSAGSQAKGVGKCLSDLLPGLTAFSRGKSENNDKCPPATSAKNTMPCEGSGDCVKFVADELKCHLDKRFNELAISLKSHIDEKLNELQREQNDKLDKIMSMLQNLNQS